MYRRIGILPSGTDMSDSIQALREECKCGHDVATHYAKTNRKFYLFGQYVDEWIDYPGACLGQHCECEQYKYETPK